MQSKSNIISIITNDVLLILVDINQYKLIGHSLKKKFQLTQSLIQSEASIFDIR